MGEKLNFHIDHIDPLGQGVHKGESGVCFIQKTLPGETGTAEIIKRSKGVSFGKLISIDSSHPDRLEPECSHFHECPGCQFLHAPYPLELESKKYSLERMLRPLSPSKVEAHGAPRRWSYRNRMQLHYDKYTNKLGLRTPKGIVEIPKCLMPNQELKTAFDELQLNWKELVKSQPPQGHIELYAKDDGVHTSVNQPYADGGFSQVFKDMNDKAITLIKNHTATINTAITLDLFGGAGNLSLHLTEAETYVVDGVIPKQQVAPHQRFIHCDLYSKSALHSLAKSIPNKVDLMLIDPPRSGFSELDDFIGHFRPKNIIYMSCFAPTMVRDLKKIGVQNPIVHMLDFFPSTHHMEALAFIRLE